MRLQRLAGWSRGAPSRAAVVGLPCSNPPCSFSRRRGLCSAAAAEVVTLPEDIKHIVFTEEELQGKVAEMGRAIGQAYQGKQLLVVGVLTGAFIFTADLVRAIQPHVPTLRVDFIRASSYGAASQSDGTVTVDHIGDSDRWAGWHVLLVEDIIDSGHTLRRLGEEFAGAGANSVKFAALLDKKGRRRVECFPDFVGYECPNEFIVGYGLDYDEKYRWLPYVAALKESAYQ